MSPGEPFALAILVLLLNLTLASTWPYSQELGLQRHPHQQYMPKDISREYLGVL